MTINNIRDPTRGFYATELFSVIRGSRPGIPNYIGGKTILIAEGPNDSSFFSNIVDKNSCCQVWPSYGKSEVYKTILMLALDGQRSLLDGVIAVVDSDYDHLLALESVERKIGRSIPEKVAEWVIKCYSIKRAFCRNTMRDIVNIDCLSRFLNEILSLPEDQWETKFVYYFNLNLEDELLTNTYKPKLNITSKGILTRIIESIFFTDGHDLETMLLRSNAYDKFADDFIGKQFLEKMNADVIRKCLESCVVPLGYVGLFKEINDLKFPFKSDNIRYSNFINSERCEIELNKLFDKNALISANNIDWEKIRKFVDECLKSHSSELSWEIARGHDSMQVLAIFLSEDGRVDKKYVRDFKDRPESVLRNALIAAYSQKGQRERYMMDCNLMVKLILWEQKQPRYRIFGDSGQHIREMMSSRAIKQKEPAS